VDPVCSPGISWANLAPPGHSWGWRDPRSCPLSSPCAPQTFTHVPDSIAQTRARQGEKALPSAPGAATGDERWPRCPASSPCSRVCWHLAEGGGPALLAGRQLQHSPRRGDTPHALSLCPQEPGPPGLCRDPPTSEVPNLGGRIQPDL